MTASIDIPTAEKVARLYEAMSAAQSDLLSARDSWRAAGMAVAREADENDGRVGPRALEFYRRRTADLEAAEQRYDAADRAWEQTR